MHSNNLKKASNFNKAPFIHNTPPKTSHPLKTQGGNKVNTDVTLPVHRPTHYLSARIEAQNTKGFPRACFQGSTLSPCFVSSHFFGGISSVCVQRACSCVCLCLRARIYVGYACVFVCATIIPQCQFETPCSLGHSCQKLKLILKGHVMWTETNCRSLSGEVISALCPSIFLS